MGYAKTATFQLPPPIAELVRRGDELGTADDKVFGGKHNKQRGGTIGEESQIYIVSINLS